MNGVASSSINYIIWKSMHCRWSSSKVYFLQFISKSRALWNQKRDNLHRTKLSWFLSVILERQTALIADPTRKNMPKLNCKWWLKKGGLSLLLLMNPEKKSSTLLTLLYHKQFHFYDDLVIKNVLKILLYYAWSQTWDK